MPRYRFFKPRMSRRHRASERSDTFFFFTGERDLDDLRVFQEYKGFLRGLGKNTYAYGIRKIGVKRPVPHGGFAASYPITIVGPKVKCKEQHLEILLHSDNRDQTVYLYSEKEKFLNIVKKIQEYNATTDSRLKEELRE